MPDHKRIPAALHADIKCVCETMIRVHYFEEANWLWMAAASPTLCQSAIARRALQNARIVARQFGFPAVARWVEADVLSDRPD